MEEMVRLHNEHDLDTLKEMVELHSKKESTPPSNDQSTAPSVQA